MKCSEWKDLSEIAILKRGIVISKDYLRDNNGDYPVYSSQTVDNGIMGYIDTFMFDGEFLTWTTDGANAGTIFHRKGKFNITNVCGLIEILDDTTIKYRFLYFWLSYVAKQYVLEGMGNPKLMSNRMGLIKIPLPHIKVQEEIVEILDSFTNLIDALNEELSLRQKQFEYYREKLLTFDDKVERNTGIRKNENSFIEEIDRRVNNKIEELLARYNPNGVPNALLVECSFVDYGYPFTSSMFTDDSSYIPIIRIRDVKPGKASTYYKGNYSSEYIVKRGDILVGMDGEFNLEKWNDIDSLLNQRVARITEMQSISIQGYLYHILGPIFKKLEKEISGGSVKHLSVKIINSISIPLPHIKVQEQIAEVLDSFTDLISSLKEEIALRQKQYEYYREKLLTFD